MKILDCAQGTSEWHDIRGGLPSASCFDRVLTPTGKKSSQWDSYIGDIICFRIGANEDDYQSEWMVRGNDVEPEARAFYEMETGRSVTTVGFVLHDSEKYGCSPDGLIYTGDVLTKGLEMKCPKKGTYISYLRSHDCPSKYIPQVQGSMLVTGAETWDFMPYHPDLTGNPAITKPNIFTIERDDAYCSLLDEALLEFCDKLESAYKDLTQ